MAGFQFVHLESYSRKPDKGGRTVGFVLDEAERKPEASTHVEYPGTPEVVFGVGVGEVRALHDARVAEARAEVTGGKARKVRTDQHTLLTVIASHPAAMGQVRVDPAVAGEVAAWEDRTVAWLRETWGDRLVGVVRHVDESHPHLHAYIVPDDPGMKAKSLHPGAVAKAAAKEAAEAEGCDGKAANAKGDAAYKAAMRSMQDGYWEKAGLPSGLARLGPGRRRLDRGAWKAEQAAAGATAHALGVAGVAQAEAAVATAARVEAEARAAELAERGAAFVAAAWEAASKAKREADAAEAERAAAAAEAARLRRIAGGIVSRAKGEARQIVGGARQQSIRLQRIGARLGALWAGFAGVGRRLEQRSAVREAAAEARAAAGVIAAKETVLRDVGGDLVAARQAAADALRRAEIAEVRAKSARGDLRKAEVEMERERQARQAAERECEGFRGRWAEADNARLALEKRHTLH